MLCPTLRKPLDWPARFLYPWYFSGKNTGMGCPFLFRGSSQPRYQILGSVSPVLQADSIPTEPWGKPLSLVRLFTTPWIVTLQALLSMQFSRQDYWSRLPFPFPGDLPLEKGSNPPLLHWQTDSLPLCHIFSICVCLYCSKRKI